MGARRLGLAITVLVLLNVIAVVLDSVPKIDPTLAALIRQFELMSLAVFGLEYALRLYAIVESARFRAPILGRLRWAMTPLALVDLVAIIPGVVGLSGLFDLRVLRMARLLRLLRILKLGRYSVAIQTLARVLKKTSGEIVVFAFIAVLLTIVCGTLMYQLESEAQPEQFSSIPASMWWAMTTLTTVGYGDVVPTTPWGRLLASLIAFLGIGIFALPAGVLGGAFVEELRSRRLTAHFGDRDHLNRPS
ncbi:MAG: ion transporter [Deltaproteobacteria bacterium]|nr:ion transporter [Deltaproteobacteria bacterium]